MWAIYTIVTQRSSLVLSATIHIDLDDDFALSDLKSIHDDPFLMYQFEIINDETIKFLIDTGEHRDAISAALSKRDSVYSIEKIGASQLLITKRSSGVLPIVRKNHGMFQKMNEFHGTQRSFDIVAFSRDDLKDIIEGLERLGSVKLERLKPFTGPSSLFSTRQAEVLKLAYENGYFDWPRSMDSETLADQLGVNRTTFLEHLRKAEEKAIEETLNNQTLTTNVYQKSRD